jgi:hypothetical protein
MTDTMHGTQGGAADAARTVGTTAKEKATDVASSASGEAKAVAQDAKDQAREVINRSREQLRVQASEQGDRLASTLRDVGDQLRAMSRGEARPDSQVASLTSQLADTVSNAASRIGDGGYQGAIDDVKRFARNRPGMFLLGALGAGFVVGRVVKSVDTGSLLQAAKADESGASQFAAGSGALSASSSFDPQLEASEPSSSLPPPIATPAPTTTPPTAMPGAVPPEVP